MSFIRGASIRARDCMFEDLPSGHTSRLLGLSSIARAVGRKKSKLFDLLISSSDLPDIFFVSVGMSLGFLILMCLRTHSGRQD